MAKRLPHATFQRLHEAKTPKSPGRFTILQSRSAPCYSYCVGVNNTFIPQHAFGHAFMTHISRSDSIATAFATLGPIGHLPKAPGTWGSAAAVIAAPFVFLPLSPTVRCLILAALFIVGGLAASRAEAVIGSKDPGSVVIDEVLGQWMVFALFPIMTTWQILLGFILFRLFDIAKPWPVKAAENWLPGGFGVMIDDLLAGLYAALCMWGARWAYVHWVAPLMN